MKCTKCHNITNDSSKFCSTCGARMDDAVAEIHRDINESEKKAKFKTMGAVLAVVLVAIVLFCMWERPNPEIYVGEYLYLEVGGFEGEGRVFPRVDKESLAQSIEDILDEDITDIRKYHIEQLVHSVSLEYEKKDIWKNGDLITIEISINELLTREFEIEFILGNIDLIVEELLTMREINPFDYLEIDYVGTMPLTQVVVSFDFESLGIYGEKVSVVPEGPVSEGDEIIITIEGITEEDLERKGITFTRWSEIHVCDDMESNRFVWDLDDITEDIEEKLEELTKVNLMNYFIANNIYYTDIQYEGMYLVVSKSNMSKQENCAYVVLSSKVSREEDPDNLVYFPMGVTNLVLTSDGKYIYDLEIKMPEEYSGIVIAGDRYIVGYSDNRLMYQSLVGINKADCLWDVSPELEIEN